MKKGISLVLLIVTIIIMLILGGIIIMTVVDTNMVDNAKDSVTSLNRKEIEDQIINVHDLGYYAKKYGDSLSQETIDELTDLVIKTGVDVEKFIIWYDINDGYDYIFYRLDKVTLEEARSIEAEVNPRTGQQYVQFMFDIDFDGRITINDYTLLRGASLRLCSITPMQAFLGNVNIDGYADSDYSIALSSIDYKYIKYILQYDQYNLNSTVDRYIAGLLSHEPYKYTGVTFLEHIDEWTLNPPASE